MIEPAGIYRKFDIRRTDGSSEPGRKHERCSYFVLDLEHDPFAKPALEAYAAACEATFPELARDLRRIARATASDGQACNCREAFCPHIGGSLGPSETADLLMTTRRP